MENELIKQEAVKDAQIVSQSDALLTMIERIAQNPDADIQKLEKMLDMQERVLNRQAKQDYAKSLSAMQSKLPVVAKNSEGHNTKYACFEDIVKAVRPHLEQHGFAVSFKVNQDQSGITVKAALNHSGGHSEETQLILPADTSGSKNAVQAIGSTVSYGKRYTMCALLNIATGDDDNAASAYVEIISDDQLANLEALIDEVNVNRSNFLKYLKVAALSQLPANKYQQAVKALEARRGQA